MIPLQMNEGKIAKQVKEELTRQQLEGLRHIGLEPRAAEEEQEAVVADSQPEA